MSAEYQEQRRKKGKANLGPVLEEKPWFTIDPRLQTFIELSFTIFFGLVFLAVVAGAFIMGVIVFGAGFEEAWNRPVVGIIASLGLIFFVSMCFRKCKNLCDEPPEI